MPFSFPYILSIIFLLSLHFTSGRTSTSLPEEESFWCSLPNQNAASLTTKKMKGLLKGFRYFSQIFDDKEEQMEIGFPTDVKHVAHIGLDGPSANSTPTWMNEYKSAPDQLSSAEVNPSADMNSAAAETQEPPAQSKNEKPKHKSRRKSSTGSGSPLGSPKSTDKPSRRHRPSNSSMDSTKSDSSSTHSTRRYQNSEAESPAHDLPAIPKHSRRKKSKGASSVGGGDSTKSTRSKGQNSLPDIIELGGESESGQGQKNIENHGPGAVLEEHWDANGR